MPRGRRTPAGGYKVIYEYANRLQHDGYKVYIVYPGTMLFKTRSLLSKCNQIRKYIFLLLRGASCKRWFALDGRISERMTLSLNYRDVPKTDFYVATAVLTSTYLKDYPISRNRKLYLIQDFEAWGVTEDFVRETYRYGLKNIAISNWLADEIYKSGATCTIIKNGFDFTYFQLRTPIEQRDRFHVSMMYHTSKRKGCQDGINALKKVKEIYPQLSATLFGVAKMPKELPAWIEYYQSPTKDVHNRIYNESSIYLAPSHQEGWGLTVGEAMICGAAVVCTDTLGFKEMVIHEENGLMCSVKDVAALANNIKRLIEDNAQRIKLAKKGNETIQKFRWDSSYKKFKNLLE